MNLLNTSTKFNLFPNIYRRFKVCQIAISCALHNLFTFHHNTMRYSLFLSPFMEKETEVYSC